MNTLDELRHSAAHLLAAAVIQLWPETKRTIGPSIENGFYYDFDFGSVKISESDFPAIEAKMREILATWDHFEKKIITKDEALHLFSDNPYKKELIEEFASKGEELTIYTSGSYVDLCRGGHIENPKNDLQYFKLLSVAGAYWRGSEKNPMLTRIYGTAFHSQQDLDTYLKEREEIESLDHRKLGKDLDLFVFSDLVGKGLPLLTAKGASIRRVLQRFIEDEEIVRGYQHVITPPLANLDLYRTSGHYPYYKDTMYPPMTVDEEELMLRPMTCPHHFMLYKSRPHSYRELPVKIAETSPQFRYEKSGELTGLLRVRMFTLSDAHIIAMPEQAHAVINDVLELIDYVNTTFGLVPGKDYRYRLSLGDRSDDKKYYKDDASWEYAEQVLRDALTQRGSPFFEAAGEAAFYGPKIDIQLKNVHGKEETAFTVQYDFVMPKRFSMTYIDHEGKEQQPIVIHRASLGAFERTMAFLIERYKGSFPTWLSPVQAKILPIADRHIEAAQQITMKLRKDGIRVELDQRNERLQAKIRDAQKEKVPYMLIIGDKESQSESVAVRKRSGEDLGIQTVDQWLQIVKREINDRVIS